MFFSPSNAFEGGEKSTQSETSKLSATALADTVHSVFPIFSTVNLLFPVSPGFRLIEVNCNEGSHSFTSGIFTVSVKLSSAGSAAFGSFVTVALIMKQ